MTNSNQDCKHNVPVRVLVNDQELMREFRRLVFTLHGREYGFLGQEVRNAIRAWIPEMKRQVQEAGSSA